MKNFITKAGIVSFVFMTSLFLNAIAQKPVKVLFIGNSFTYMPTSPSAHDLPSLFKGLATAGGKSVTTLMDANGGQYLDATQGWQPGHSVSSATYANIHAQAWDYVVLQDNEGYFAGYVGQFPSYSISAHKRLIDSIAKILPCAKVILFAGWGQKGGIPSSIPGDNTSKMNIRIDSNYQILNSQFPKKVLIAPFGKAWNNEIAALPSIENSLFYTDGQHPEATGQLSNAAVLYTMIFKQDPTNINYVPSGISTTNASLVRSWGYKTVMTPYIYASHQMPSTTPVVTNNSGVLSVTGSYSAYQWYLNNVAISGATSSTYTPTTNGSYMVIATPTGSSCANNWSFPVVVTATGVEESVNNNNVVLYPNPVSGESVIELKDMEWEGSRIEIINMVGQVMQSRQFTSNRFFIYKNDFQTGMYIYEITDKGGNKFVGKINVL